MTDLVVALSEATVQRIFREVVDNFSFDDPNIQHTWDWGYVTGHLGRGKRFLHGLKLITMKGDEG
jgi:hypothetical protein